MAVCVTIHATWVARAGTRGRAEVPARTLSFPASVARTGGAARRLGGAHQHEAE